MELGGGARDLAEEIKGGMSGQPGYKTNDLSPTTQAPTVAVNLANHVSLCRVIWGHKQYTID